jgi:hypothetical protein
MTYPFGGRNTDSALGTLDSSASVSTGRCPAVMRRCSIERDMLECDQFDMAIASSRTRRERKRRWFYEHEAQTERAVMAIEKAGKRKDSSPDLAHG